MQVSTRRGGRHFAGRGVAGWWKVAFAIVLTAAMVLQSSNIQAIAGELLDPAGAGQVAGGEVEQQVADESVAEGLTEADAATETDAVTETDATVETDGDATEGDDAAADGVEGRKISGPNTVAVGESIGLKTDNNSRLYEHRWTVADSSIATTENGNRSGCTVKGVSAGTTTVTHEWGYYELLGFGKWHRVGVETYTVTVTSPVPEGNYPVYIYTLVPGVEIDDSRSNDEKWNGMGVGFISYDAVKAPAEYGDEYKFDFIPDEVNYANLNFPEIRVNGREYTYAAPGSANEYKEGYYRIEWIRMVTAGGANTGANSYNPVVDSDIITFHLDGRILPNETDQFNVSFYVREAGSSDFEPREEYARFLPAGTPKDQIKRPDLDEEVTINGAKYTLDAWYTDETCTQKATFEGNLEGDVAYYARYVPAASQTYTVTYKPETNNGQVSPTSQSDQVLESDGITGSTATANAGYEFVGWYKADAEGNVPEAAEPISTGATLSAEDAVYNLNKADGVNADTIYVARFVADADQNFTVTYKPETNNGQVSPTSQSDQVLESDGVNADTTYVARFAVDSGQTKTLRATVDYALGGDVQEAANVLLEKTVQVLEPDTLSTAGVTAKEFAGWTLDSITINGEEVESLPATVNNGDRVVYHYVADTSALSVSNYSGVYDGESHGITVNGLIEGDVVSYSVSNSFTDVTGSPVSVTATVTRNGVAIWTGTASVSITPATIRVTISDATKVEGQVDPGLESTYVVPVAGELAGFEGSIAREPGEEPGTYVIGRGTLVLVDRTAQGVNEKDFKASNYTLEVVPGTFTITAAPGGGDNPGGGTDTPDNPGGTGGTNPGGAGTGAGTGTGTGAGTNPAPTPVTATADDDAAADDEAINDDENPLADDASADDESDDAESIDDDSNPLASGTGSTAETCWVHWAVIVGIIVTVAYFAVCAARTRRATDELASFEDDVLDRR